MFNFKQLFNFVLQSIFTMKDKREQIIETAMQLFAEKGFEGASIRDIAEKASVNVAMVNYYFGTKEKLFEKIIEYKSSATRGLLDEILHTEVAPQEAAIARLHSFFCYSPSPRASSLDCNVIPLATHHPR